MMRDDECWGGGGMVGRGGAGLGMVGVDGRGYGKIKRATRCF